jgi:hypothetical protein
VTAPGQEIRLGGQRPVRRELGHVNEHRYPPVMRGRNDLRQRRQPARRVRGARDRQEPRHGTLVKRCRDISGLEGAVRSALDVSAAGHARPGQQVGVMLGHRSDHDIAGTQPQPTGQVIDGFGRVLADDRDITRIWPASGESQRGQASALVSQDRGLGLVSDAVLSVRIPGKESLDRVQHLRQGICRARRVERKTWSLHTVHAGHRQGVTDQGDGQSHGGHLPIVPDEQRQNDGLWSRTVSLPGKTLTRAPRLAGTAARG